MKKELVCVVCPFGCSITASLDDDDNLSVEGNKCRRGIEYAKMELTNPVRMLTTTIRVKGGNTPLIPVRSDKPLPKELLLDCMKVINTIVVPVPVKMGDRLVEDILGSGVDIIASCNVF